MREFSPNFLMTSTADCVSLLPTAYTVLGLKVESGWVLSEQLGCRVECAIPDGTVTDVHMSVWDATVFKATEMQMCVSRLMVAAVVCTLSVEPSNLRVKLIQL